MPTEFQHDPPKAKTLGEFERLNDVVKLSAHVTRILGQNPGQMTLQGTNSYLLQPPSSPLAPIILIDTSSPHTASQYVDLVLTHLHHLALESGMREVHFESEYAVESLSYLPAAVPASDVKAVIIAGRNADPRSDMTDLTEYGPGSGWVTQSPDAERRFPVIEHIVLTHRHLDHVGALPTLLTALDKLKLPPPRIWKMPSPDELTLTLSDRDRLTTDAALVNTLPHGLYTPFTPFQPLHPIMPGLMISIIDPKYRHLLKHDKEGKPRWNEVPEVARVSVRCLKTPGHTQDSVSLVMCEGEKGVFTGDTVLGEGTTIFTDLSAYMLSLKTLQAIKPQTLYPAHGKHISGPGASAAHIEAYIAHRQLREEQILELLHAIAADGGLMRLIEAFFARKKAQEKKEYKEKKERASGKPYVPKVKQTAEEKEEEAEDRRRGLKVPGKDDKGKDKDKEEEEEDDEKVDEKHLAFDNPGVSLALLTRLIYDTTKEQLIFAAQKPVLAHLEKLEKDGRVQRVTVQLPKIVDMVVGEDKEALEGWEIVRDEQ